jgi:chromosomal replication initiation ATPase DnaA
MKNFFPYLLIRFYESSAQMVVTCDRFPKEIEVLKIEFVPVISLAVDTKPADLETRVVILNRLIWLMSTCHRGRLVFIAERFKQIFAAEGA